MMRRASVCLASLSFLGELLRRSWNRVESPGTISPCGGMVLPHASPDGSLSHQWRMNADLRFSKSREVEEFGNRSPPKPKVFTLLLERVSV